jgi:SAM-dependent methyltransferase
MVKVDIMNIPYKDDSFDVILCSHVLEHVANDQKAMRELFRVLIPGGWAILQSPVDRQRDETFEDPNVTSPQDRLRLFGQSNHVRVYGRDYKDRLEKAGFSVKIDGYVRSLSADEINVHGLLEDEDIYLCTKPRLKEAGGEAYRN